MAICGRIPEGHGRPNVLGKRFEASMDRADDADSRPETVKSSILLDNFGRWSVETQIIFFANAVSCCECHALVNVGGTCLRVSSTNHCDLF